MANDAYLNDELNNGALDWDSEIGDDGASAKFVILPEGVYNFTVTKFERGTFAGSAKIPTCNKAVLTLKVNAPEGVAVFKTDLILYKSLEWKISAFFRSIGQKKHGERMVPRWNEVAGSTGRAKIFIREYEKDGEKRQANEIEYFMDPDPDTAWVEDAKSAPEQKTWGKGF